MCNGNNHPADCECGFGPPYPGHISIIKVTGWIEELAEDPAALQRRLDPMGLEKWDYERLQSEYHQARIVVDAQDSLLQRVRRVFQGITFETEDSQVVVVDVPLFRLHSPAVLEARVTYSEGHELSSGASWRVKLLGLGSGPSTTVQVAFNTGFASVAGECKEIFVPIALEFEHVKVLQRGKPAGLGTRLHVKANPEPSVLRTRGSRTYSPDQCAIRHKPGTCETDNFPLAGDRGREPVTREFRSSKDVAHEVGLSLTAFGIGADALAQVRNTTHFRLGYSLPPGHDYVALREPRGVYWKLDDGAGAAAASA